MFSWVNHGIHLYPPIPNYSDRPYYRLRVTNRAYSRAFIEMVKTLIKEKVPFKARELEKVLNYLCGETYFEVNKYGKNRFNYISSKEYKNKYFHYIEWDKLETPKWKSK